MRNVVAGLLLLSYASAVQANIRYLVPVAGVFAGATTTWVGSVAGYNTSATPVLARIPLVCAFECGADVPFAPYASAFIRPRTGASPGRILHADGDTLVLTNRIGSLDAPFRAQIPLVSESDFLSGTAHIIDIPAEPTIRVLLRIYTFNDEPGTFEIRIFTMSEEQFVDERVVQTLTGMDEFTPGYVEFPAFPAAERTTPPTVYRVEIQSMSSTRYWAFVSLTDVRTNDVSILLPNVR